MSQNKASLKKVLESSLANKDAAARVNSVVETVESGAVGDISGVTAGAGLTGGGSFGNVTLNVDSGITANKIVKLDGTGKLPAVDGSQLLNLPGGGGSFDPLAAENAFLPDSQLKISSSNAPVAWWGAPIDSLTFDSDIELSAKG